MCGAFEDNIHDIGAVNHAIKRNTDFKSLKCLFSVFLLRCATQTYAWGKVGVTSEVALLSKGADPDFQLKDDTPYAEVCM